MATVVKNFRIKSGLIVEGTTGTIDGHNILTESTAGDQYILNLVGGATLVKSVSGNLSVDNAGVLSLDQNGLASDLAGSRLYADGSTINVDEEGIFNDFVSNGMATSTDVNNAISTAATDATNKANQALSDAQSFATTAANNAKSAAESTAATDATNKANAAQSAAESFATTAANNAQSAAQTYAEGQAQDAYDNAVATAATDATNKANAAESNANDYTEGLISSEVTNRNNAIDSAISTEVTNRNSAIATAKSEAISSANSYTDGEIAALVDSAPALLDTLNELAAAIADNPNYASDVANLVATKADKTYVDSEISDLNTAAQGYATTAQSNAASYTDSAVGSALESAEGYADSVAGQALSDAESYTDSAISNGNSAATPAYQAINLAGYTRQVGNWALASTAGSQVTAFSYSASWGSAEFLVRVMSNTSGHQHSQLSKILVTTDGVGNVAITEYGIVATNGNMGDITASNAGGTISILVTPTYASSEVIVSGTLLAYND